MPETYLQAVREIDRLARDKARLEAELQRAEHDRQMLRDQSHEVFCRLQEMSTEAGEMRQQLDEYYHQLADAQRRIEVLTTERDTARAVGS